MNWRWWQREPTPDQSLIGTVQRIERDLAIHSAAFREYMMQTDIRLEIIDLLATKVLPQLSRSLSDGAEANRVLAETQARLNDTFERVLAALPGTAPVELPADNHVMIRPTQEMRHR